MQGGCLTIGGALAINGNTVTAGVASGGGTTAGSAFGSGLFMQGSGTITFQPGAGQVQTIANTIADEAGVVAGGYSPPAGFGTPGSWSLTKDGGGTLTLSGVNSYSGGTTISAGTLAVSADNNLGNASGTLAFGGGTLQYLAGFTSNRAVTLNAGGGTFDTNGNNATLAGAIGGTGGLTKIGGGTLTLSGANAYTGATTINGGTLALSGSGDVSSSSGVTVGNGATFDVSASSFFFVPIATLAGSGTVQLGGNGLVIVNGSTEFSGAINGSGGLEIFSGTQTLSGINTYTNVTQIDQGATLALKGAGSIASSAVVTFAPFGSGLATLDISQTSSGASVGGLFDNSGIGRVSLGGQTLTITNGSSFRGVIQDGGIAGGSGGGLIISAASGQDLSGVNTYTGSTTITGNALLTPVGQRQHRKLERAHPLRRRRDLRYLGKLGQPDDQGPQRRRRIDDPARRQFAHRRHGELDQLRRLYRRQRRAGEGRQRHADTRGH
jgi:autotransporter-associated beta strand protein